MPVGSSNVRVVIRLPYNRPEHALVDPPQVCARAAPRGITRLTSYR
jgi:hypothetical protein